MSSAISVVTSFKVSGVPQTVAHQSFCSEAGFCANTLGSGNIHGISMFPFNYS